MTDLIYGRNAVIEAFDAGLDIEKVFVLNNIRGEYEIKIRNLCKVANVPLAKVPEIKLNELSKYKAHQGIIAMISPIKYYEFQDIISSAFDQGRIPLVVVLDGVTDVRNIGAIARSAYYFGADALIISGNFAGSINEDTVKTSAGAILKLSVCRTSSLLSLVSNLQSSGLKVVATSLKDSIEPEKSDMKEPLAIILGAEDKGLHYKVLELVDEVIKIPSFNDFDSLNVSVAAGILLYECKKQRS
ncbi:MAG: 23S rRNA (guanosine(2251)-2'-O)-methyltransferase RlmB [Saprospiraceae bacterium]|nr:23S rRNA (guanosine(2251)-2'-O)-methyltransferase RlmB [Saprospiraceae bacterium]